MLDKDPRKRPFTAAAAEMALKTAQQNAFAGVSVAQHALGGFSPLKLETDREAAAKALGVKKRREREETEIDGTPFLEKPWYCCSVSFWL